MLRMIDISKISHLLVPLTNGRAGDMTSRKSRKDASCTDWIYPVTLTSFFILRLCLETVLLNALRRWLLLKEVQALVKGI